MDRKLELQQELDIINKKEMEKKLKELNHLENSVESQLKLSEAKSHKFVMRGDFIIKFFMAFAVSFAFMYVVWTGNTMEPSNLIGSAPQDNNFQLLSVLGPLFGMVLSYYFGNTKASANGE